MTFPGQMTVIFIAIISCFLYGIQHKRRFCSLLLAIVVPSLLQESRQQRRPHMLSRRSCGVSVLSIKQDHLCKLNSKRSVCLLQYAVKECYLYKACALGNVIGKLQGHLLISEPEHAGGQATDVQTLINMSTREGAAFFSEIAVAQSEGAWNAPGALYFTDTHANCIRNWTSTGRALSPPVVS